MGRAGLPRVRWVVRWASSSAFAAAVLLALAATTGSREVDAQGRADAGDAAASAIAACTFTVTGGLPSAGTCTAQMLHRERDDGSTASDGVVITADSPEFEGISAWFVFMAGPRSGVVRPFGGDGDPSPFVGRAEVRSRKGVEWFGSSGVQGTFIFDLASATRTKTDGAIGYIVHGELMIEMPVSNLNSANPRNPLRILTLRATF